MIGISVLWFYYAEADDPLTFYLSAACRRYGRIQKSSMLRPRSSVEEILGEGARRRQDNYVYVTTLIFYVLTVIESIHFIEEHDEEYNKHKMEWDTFSVAVGTVLFAECATLVHPIRRTVINSDDAFTDLLPCAKRQRDYVDGVAMACAGKSVLENNYPSASALNNLSYACVGLRFIFPGLRARQDYVQVSAHCEEHEIDEVLKALRDNEIKTKSSIVY